MSVKRVVMDASVALKWRLRDEEATLQADALLDDFLADKVALLTQRFLIMRLPMHSRWQ